MVYGKYISKMDYSDLTVGIPIRVDSSDRAINLRVTVDFLRRLENITIIVLEADVKPSLTGMNEDMSLFVEDTNPLFHKNRYIKKLLEISSTKFVAIWDCDVVVSERMIEDAIVQLRSNRADASIPYNGQCHDVFRPLLDVFLKNRSVEFLLDNRNIAPLMFGHHSCGGVFIVDKDKHMKAGGENLRIMSWGPEDLERYKRWEICGMSIHRGSEPMFHLHHRRGINSSYVSTESRLHLLGELIKTCRIKGKKH